MKLKRYHIVILREDGKQYHNKVLDFLYIRKKFIVLGSLLFALILGNIAFLFLAFYESNLLLKTKQAKEELKTTQEALLKVKDDLSFMEEKLQNAETKLYQLEKLAREQNLTLPKLSFAGTGGEVNKSSFVEEENFFNSPKLNKIYKKVKETREYCETLSKETSKLDSVLNPHLLSLARKPSIWPVKGFISSPFGGRPDPFTGAPSWHRGIDISAPYGTPVVATAEGIVVFSGWKTGLGNTVIINHGEGFTTLYGHLSKMTVKPGQKVKRWDVIGRVGSTGRSTGNHCHYEVHKDNKVLNPIKFILF